MYWLSLKEAWMRADTLLRLWSGWILLLTLHSAKHSVDIMASPAPADTFWYCHLSSPHKHKGKYTSYILSVLFTNKDNQYELFTEICHSACQGGCATPEEQFQRCDFKHDFPVHLHKEINWRQAEQIPFEWADSSRYSLWACTPTHLQASLCIDI